MVMLTEKDQEFYLQNNLLCKLRGFSEYFHSVKSAFW